VDAQLINSFVTSSSSKIDATGPKSSENTGTFLAEFSNFLTSVGRSRLLDRSNVRF